MAGTVRSLAALDALLADNTAGDISAQDARDFLHSAYQPAGVTPGGRLTTESGVPVSTADRTSQGTIYYAIDKHNRIGLYDGTSWTLHTFTERSLALSSLTSGKNYDVFMYDNSGTLTLELSAAWTNDTTRADALTTQDGVMVKSGATTRRWLGTIRTTGTATTEDSAAKRFLWNWYNQLPRPLRKAVNSSSFWGYGSTTIRQANADTAHQVEAVNGQPTYVEIGLVALTQSSGTNAGIDGIGVDSTTAYSSDQIGGNSELANMDRSQQHTHLRKEMAAGYHYYAWLESATAAVSFNHFGDRGYGATPGLFGSIRG